MTGAERLAADLVAGPWRREPLVVRATRATGRLLANPAIRRLVDSVLVRWPLPPDAGDLAAFLAD